MTMRHSGWGRFAATVLILVVAGCGDGEEVRTYTVPKTAAPATRPDAAPQAAPAPTGTPTPAPARAGVVWDAPAGWEVDPPRQMREAGYHTGEGAQRADIVISKMTTEGVQRMWLANVNRWRAQAGLEPTDEQAVAKLEPKTSKIGGREARTYDFLGPDGPARLRNVVTMITDGETVWFVRLSGQADSVAKQVATFEVLVQSFRFPQ